MFSRVYVLIEYERLRQEARGTRISTREFERIEKRYSTLIIKSRGSYIYVYTHAQIHTYIYNIPISLDMRFSFSVKRRRHSLCAISVLILFKLVLITENVEHTVQMCGICIYNFASVGKWCSLHAPCSYYLLSSSLCCSPLRFSLFLPFLPFPLPVVIMACNSVITARAILNYGVT